MQNVHKTISTKSRRFCSVPQCSSYCTKDISLHKFPNDKKRLQEWQRVLKIGKPISKYMLVCSKHFTVQDFLYGEYGLNNQRSHLKSNAVPSQNLPVTDLDHSLKKFKPLRCNWLSRIDNKSKYQEETNNEAIPLDLPKKNGENETNTISPDPTVLTPVEVSLPKTRTIGTQTDDFSKFELPQILDSNEKMGYFTGVNLTTVDTYINCCENIAKHNSYNCNNLKTNIILVLCKLKLNLTFVCLSVLFGVTPSTCSNIFYSTVTLLATAIRPAIYWPSKDEILRNMPKCFKNFKDTRVVLDCTEIKIQKLKCLKCRVLSYSHYKSNHTAKILVGITPSGLISYVSPAYGGRATDKSIFNNENLIEELDSGDAIMVDKGVLIASECEEKQIKLHRPPFLKNKKQLSKNDANKTAEIARARVHVERAIQRMKIFKILDEQILWYLFSYIDDIVTIIAATVNISPPILADDKF